MTDIRRSTDRESLARDAARLIVDEAKAAVAERGRFTLALAGGSTPKRTYELLATDELVEEMPWEQVAVFFGDERPVPPDHEESNYRMADEAMLSVVPISLDHVHRMLGESDDLEAAAIAYATLLHGELGDPPRLDLVLLGIGDDGHTASIFPDVVDDCRGPGWVRAIDSAAKGPRLTLTYPALNAARHVAFLVGGEGKADVLHRVLREQGGEPPYPSAQVKPSDGKLTFLVDEAAAARL